VNLSRSSSKNRFDVVVGGGHNGLGPKPLYCSCSRTRTCLSRRIERFRVGSATFRMKVALSELPKFTAAPRNDDGAHLGSGIIIAPSLESMNRAFADARLTGRSREPIVEMLIPSTLDTSLAPKGAHVASLYCQHFSYKLPGDRDWHQERQHAVHLMFATVDS
jgi:phytoene dehydrogenase-like protein